MESYAMDPSMISLEGLGELILGHKLIPSRVSLQERTGERLHVLADRGIGDLKQLLSALGSKEKIRNLAEETGIPENYLVLLKREAGSYLARPYPLADFPGIPYEYAEVLKAKGIRNSADFFELVQDPDQKALLSATTGIPAYRLEEIFILCDLSRVNGVGPLFARILYESGIRSLQDLGASTAASLNPAIMEVIRKYGYQAHPLSDDDLAYCIFYTRVLLEQKEKP